ncbi:PLD-like domain-containing protein [Humidesulfovibrio mexicanus]|uniref:phospholipase D n=1 Tax=Humidesulfovibrio mexicanus TaxID=147047 RepID=A0A239BE62_9BACT|nr:phospholipase D family protein [Humidesulfovibrio mexicanus]SNS05912.1 PLD-like domain-containing protein [Humidesulfovibrio mexicanus]
MPFSTRLFTLFLVVWLPSQALAAEVVFHDTSAEVYFSPRGGAQQALLRHIEQARKSIFVQAYGFTSPEIASALLAAADRGVHVEAILDRSQRKARGTKAGALAEAGIPVYIDSRHAIAHNKVMVLDRRIVITGSYNFTKSAETRNAENLLIVESPELARKYLSSWRKHKKHSKPWLQPSN